MSDIAMSAWHGRALAISSLSPKCPMRHDMAYAKRTATPHRLVRPKHIRTQDDATHNMPPRPMDTVITAIAASKNSVLHSCRKYRIEKSICPEFYSKPKHARQGIKISACRIAGNNMKIRKLGIKICRVFFKTPKWPILWQVSDTPQAHRPCVRRTLRSVAQKCRMTRLRQQSP